MNAELLEICQRLLDPEDTTIGGGPAAAVAGAMAARLIHLTTNLSIGRNLDPGDEYFSAASQQALALMSKLAAGAKHDAAAFDAVFAGYGLPNSTPEQKLDRSRAIQAALQEATRVPLENAGLCYAIQTLSRELEGKVNPNLVSDLESARQLSRAGYAAAVANVRSNLKSIKDPEFTRWAQQQLQVWEQA